MKLPRDQDKLLANTLRQHGLREVPEDRKPELTFADACRFWSITENLSGDALDDRLAIVRATLADIERQVGSAGPSSATAGIITGDDANSCATCTTISGRPFRPAPHAAAEPGRRGD